MEQAQLERGRIRSWRLPRAGYLLEVRCGRVWATVDGEVHDWLVGSGESLVLAGPARLVVEALADSEVAVRMAPRVAKAS